MKYYLFGGMSAAFLLFGSVISTELPFDNLTRSSAFMVECLPCCSLLYVAIVLVLTGLGFKVAAVPFHLWRGHL